MVQIRHELFPLHSPLLGESLLVYFPPLINMLKFGGYSYLTEILNYFKTEKSRSFLSVTVHRLTLIFIMCTNHPKKVSQKMILVMGDRPTTNQSLAYELISTPLTGINLNKTCATYQVIFVAHHHPT